ncbi:MAG: hypothetical protein AAFV98_05475 [Chloroflexota bacterium]
MPDHTQADTNSPLWMHVEMHIQNHCFGIIHEDTDVRASYIGQDRPSQILQAILATAEQIAESPVQRHANGLRRLILITIQEDLPMVTVQAITAFLSTIGEYTSPMALDYLATIKTLRELKDTASAVHLSVTQATHLHGHQGQLAYDLLKTAHLLIHAADATLKHDGTYALEKLGTALETMQYAQTCAHRWQLDYGKQEAE